VSVDALRSPLDELRDIYSAEQPRKPLDIGIPASRGRLVVRYDGRPLRFDKEDKRLGEALGFDYVTAREAARKTFKDDEYPLSIAGHFQRLVEWLQGLDETRLARVEGNSAAPTET
jgi:hypothetical protein